MLGVSSFSSDQIKRILEIDYLKNVFFQNYPDDVTISKVK